MKKRHRVATIATEVANVKRHLDNEVAAGDVAQSMHAEALGRALRHLDILFAEIEAKADRRLTIEVGP